MKRDIDCLPAKLMSSCMLVAEVAEAEYSRWLSGPAPAVCGGQSVSATVRSLIPLSCTLAAALAVKRRNARLAYDELSESICS